MSEAKLILYELPDALRKQMDLPAVRYPIREEKQAQIFQKTGVRLDGFLEELNHFVSERPDAADTFRDPIAKIAYVAAIANGNRGDATTAVRMLELGLKHNPGNASLRANYAYGLQVLGRNGEAKAVYDKILEATNDPFLRLLAARAAGDAGNTSEARRILDGCPDGWWDDPGFADLVDTFTKSQRPIVPESTAGQRSCRACGKPLREDQSFCTACGQPRAPLAKCKVCGSKLEEEHRFCAQCGAPRSTDSPPHPPPLPPVEKSAEAVPTPPAEEARGVPEEPPGPSSRPRQVALVVVGHGILAGLTGITSLELFVLAFDRARTPVTALVAVGLLLVAGTEVLVAWALRKRRRWAYTTGIVVVSLMSLLWILGLVSGVMEIAKYGPDMGAYGWLFFMQCILATPLSATILTFSFRRPVRQWVACGSGARERESPTRTQL